MNLSDTYIEQIENKIKKNHDIINKKYIKFARELEGFCDIYTSMIMEEIDLTEFKIINNKIYCEKYEHKKKEIKLFLTKINDKY